jgi:threonine dehydratase
LNPIFQIGIYFRMFGLEILDQGPDIDAIVASIGGGEMIAGISLAVRSLRPQAQVIGVEPEHASTRG